MTYSAVMEILKINALNRILHEILRKRYTIHILHKFFDKSYVNGTKTVFKCILDKIFGKFYVNDAKICL